MVATMPISFGQPAFPMSFGPQPAGMSFSQGGGSQPAATTGASVLTINLPNASANNYAGGAPNASAPQQGGLNPASPQQSLYEAYNQAQAAIGNYMNMGRALQAQAFALQHLPLLPVPGMVPPPMPPVMGPPPFAFNAPPPGVGPQFNFPPQAFMMGAQPPMPPGIPVGPQFGPPPGLGIVPPGFIPPGVPTPPPFPPMAMGPGGPMPPGVFPPPPGMM